MVSDVLCAVMPPMCKHMQSEIQFSESLSYMCSCLLQVEGVKALTNTYKQIQDSFAEQVVIYLQTAWRRYAAKKQSNMANEQRKATRTSSFDRDIHSSVTDADIESPDAIG